ncbi:hypothetical protein [Stenotrophomonas sp. SY1]|uniref:hypothetical protein n=1 Tax=Stenotrophomonas sp. SY1 TaxID=477235 RepID=UPI001E5DCB38|nr:hypothetical protein [Stenotrophomonas sp. SY1]MCD9085399.1 hypothetical protein [Stenotrophomonas sp. SY1]
MEKPNPNFIHTTLSYDDVPFYRRRWFLLLMLLVFIPGLFLICATGDVFAKRNGETYKYRSKLPLVFSAMIFMLIGLVQTITLSGMR